MSYLGRSQDLESLSRRSLKIYVHHPHPSKTLAATAQQIAQLQTAVGILGGQLADLVGRVTARASQVQVHCDAHVPHISKCLTSCQFDFIRLHITTALSNPELKGPMHTRIVAVKSQSVTLVTAGVPSLTNDLSTTKTSFTDMTNEAIQQADERTTLP